MLTNVHSGTAKGKRTSDKGKDLCVKSIKSKESNEVIELGKWMNVETRFVIDTLLDRKLLSLSRLAASLTHTDTHTHSFMRTYKERNNCLDPF